jgi:hypothetical protein
MSTNAHMYYHNVTTIARYITPHVSTLKGPSSGSTIDTFRQQGQQNESPDVKFNLAACSVLTPYDYHVTHYTLLTKLQADLSHDRISCFPWSAH